MHIENFAEVTTGYNFRSAIRPDATGSIHVFQARDIASGGSFIDTGVLTRTNLPAQSATPSYLRRGDVLIVARGMKTGSFKSAVFSSDELHVVAASSVHIIRITDKGVLPEYVSYYLNSPLGQDMLASIVSGSYIGAIARRDLLEKVNVPVPSVHEQQIIIDLQHNIEEQLRALSRKNELNRQILNATFNHVTDVR